MDDYTAARFADAYERPYPEDHPRCEYCGEHLTDDEQDHEGPNELCSEHRTDDQQTEQQQQQQPTLTEATNG
jgi:hypothetical protein